MFDRNTTGLNFVGSTIIYVNRYTPVIQFNYINKIGIMTTLKLDMEAFKIWTTFIYKGNKNVVLNVTSEWIYHIDVEFDPKFSSEESEVDFTTWGSLEEEFMSDDNFDFMVEVEEQF